jgi:hypothetical protein
MTTSHVDTDYPITKKIEIGFDEEADRLVFVTETVNHGIQTMVLTRRLLIVLLKNFEKLILKVSKAIEASPQHKNEILEMESISAAERMQQVMPESSNFIENYSRSINLYLITEIKTQIKEKIIILAFSGREVSDLVSNSHSKIAISALRLDRQDAYNLFSMISKKADDAGWNISPSPAWLEKNDRVRPLLQTMN